MVLHDSSKFGAFQEGTIMRHAEGQLPPSPRVTLPADRLDPAVRRRLSGPGLRAFFTITEGWGVTAKGQRILLGSVAESTFHNWKSGKHGALSYDQLERISLILGIHKALTLLFAEDGNGKTWLHQPNDERVFGGKSPLDRMQAGSIDDIYRVRRYLDAWRGVWN
jgi:Protein of unknown function (DUF2384)